MFNNLIYHVGLEKACSLMNLSNYQYIFPKCLDLGHVCVCVCVCVCVRVCVFQCSSLWSTRLSLSCLLNSTKVNIGGGTFAVYLHALPKQTCIFKRFNAADVSPVKVSNRKGLTANQTGLPSFLEDSGHVHWLHGQTACSYNYRPTDKPSIHVFQFHLIYWRDWRDEVKWSDKKMLLK